MSNHVSLLEAATFLGVSKATLRNWDNDGKLTAIRNPVNGYRMYDIEELVALKGSLGEMSIAYKEDASAHLDSKAIKRTVSKLHSIIRDGDANSNIITRFDEITKLLFIKLYAERDGHDIFERLALESDRDYSERIQRVYLRALETAQITVPERFLKINLSADTALKCGHELSKINMSDADCDIKGLAYEDTIKGTFDKSDNQQYFTPYQVVDFMVEMMRDFLKGTVCDPACGTAGFLTKISSFDLSLDILGLEIDERLAWVSNMNLLIHESQHFAVHCLSNGGSLGNDASQFLGTVDAIITNPPFGSDYTDPQILDKFNLGFGKTSRRRGILFIEQAWNLLKDDGVVAIIIDQGVLNATSNRDVRKYILDHFKILAVIDLPESAFLPYANVSSSILIMKKVAFPEREQKVFFAKSTNIGRKSNGDDDLVYTPSGEGVLNSDLGDIVSLWNKYRRGIFAADSTCFVANLEQNFLDDSLRLDYTYHHPYRNESRSLLNKSAYKLYTLSELCVERNESYIPAADPFATTILFTGLANIESHNGKVTQMPTPAASIKSAVKRYEDGDILFSKMRPNLRKVAVMRFPHGGYASAECSVFSVRKDEEGNPLMPPELLAAILRSDFVYGQLMMYVTGIGRPRIGNKDLRKIQIPLPPKSVQDRALMSMNLAQSSVRQLRDKAQALLDEANKMDQSLINGVAEIVIGEKR